MLLEFSEAMQLTIANTLFKKEDSKKATYESGGVRTVVHYVLVRKCDSKMVMDATIINGEACLTQHHLLVCRILLKECVRRRDNRFVSKCKVWRLQEAEV